MLGHGWPWLRPWSDQGDDQGQEGQAESTDNPRQEARRSVLEWGLAVS